jgi:hypothetical protein
MYVQANGMTSDQLQTLFNQVVELSSAATLAAQSTNALMNEYQQGKGQGHSRFGDGAKVLRPFDTDDPVKYSLWREQFMNWLVFCDSRYGALLKDLENLDSYTDIDDASADVQELGMRLFSILSSYLRGPALQVVRSFGDDRNGFGVWHKLKSLYAPRARPRALAVGQAIMQHPSFPTQKSMLENLLQFDALLDPYEMASGSRMPDDLTVSTVLRCLDGATRKHLEMIMDESFDYPSTSRRTSIIELSWPGSSSYGGRHGAVRQDWKG